jgi:hypothetical protein
MLPDQWFLSGAWLLLLGALTGVGMLLLPRGHRLRRGFMPILPQLLATAGASGMVWGWFLARRILMEWKISEMPPALELQNSVERMRDWKDSLGLLLPGLLLLGLILSALPMWRGGVKDAGH